AGSAADGWRSAAPGTAAQTLRRGGPPPRRRPPSGVCGTCCSLPRCGAARATGRDRSGTAPKGGKAMRGTVGDVMTGGAASVPEGAGYRRIAQVMLEQGVGAQPVTDTAGRVVGTVAEGDLPPREGAGAEH